MLTGLMKSSANDIKKMVPAITKNAIGLRLQGLVGRWAGNELSAIRDEAPLICGDLRGPQDVGEKSRCGEESGKVPLLPWPVTR